MKVQQDKRTGLWFRPEAGELFIIREQTLYKGLDFKNHKCCLDIGANIGSFARMALREGVSQVLCYEPHPDTFTVLLKNRVAGMHCAQVAVQAYAGMVPLYLSGKYPAAHSTLAIRGRESIMVRSVPFDESLYAHRPSLLKIDCEGGEYDFLTEPLPDFVEEVGMELHLGRKHTAASAARVLRLFSDWNYHKKFRLNWHTTMFIASRHRPGLGVVGDRLKELGYG